MPAGDSRTPALSDWQAARRRQSLVPLRSNVSESVPDGIIAACLFLVVCPRVLLLFLRYSHPTALADYFYNLIDLIPYCILDAICEAVGYACVFSQHCFCLCFAAGDERLREIFV